MTAEPGRYQGKPFLRLLECYVLASIGELTPAQSEALEAMTPKLRAVYHSTGDWQSIVAAQMEFPDHLPAKLRAMWEHNGEVARERSEHLDPEQWSRAVVDENFV